MVTENVVGRKPVYLLQTFGVTSRYSGALTKERSLHIMKLFWLPAVAVSANGAKHPRGIFLFK